MTLLYGLTLPGLPVDQLASPAWELEEPSTAEPVESLAIHKYREMVLFFLTGWALGKLPPDEHTDTTAGKASIRRNETIPGRNYNVGIPDGD